MLLVGGLGLFAGNGVAIGGGLRLKRDDVLVAQPGDAPVDDGFDALADADLAGDLRSDLGVGRFAEILQALAKVLLADNGQKGRLLELDFEGLGERGVEDRIAGLVSEVGEDDGITFVDDGSGGGAGLLRSSRPDGRATRSSRLPPA